MLKLQFPACRLRSCLLSLCPLNDANIVSPLYHWFQWLKITVVQIIIYFDLVNLTTWHGASLAVSLSGSHLCWRDPILSGLWQSMETWMARPSANLPHHISVESICKQSIIDCTTWFHRHGISNFATMLIWTAELRESSHVKPGEILLCKHYSD